MIVTVTMNPAIDKTAYLNQLDRGGLNRLNNIIVDAGGKGINVSKTIKSLGGESIACGFIGGSSGILIEKILNDLNIKTDFVKIENETRTNLKVVEDSGCVTELNEPGPMVTTKDVDALVAKLLSYASPETIFVLAGSVPNGVDKNIYEIIIHAVRQKGAKVFLDADGELFLHGMKAKPNFIKPNKPELEEYFHKGKDVSDNELIEMGSELLAKGIDFVTISLGNKGAMFFSKDKNIKCPSIPVKVHSTVGAGDAMVAALTYSLDRKIDFEDCIKLAMATSTGAVTTLGTKPASKELVQSFINEVVLLPIK